MPIKNRRTKLLLLFFLTTVQPKSEDNDSFSYISLSEDLQSIFDISLNQKTKGTLSSMLKEGLIEKQESEESNQISQYRITDKGYDRICLQFPAFRFLKNDWDGLWRIISYEIPESKRHLRDRLRREMKGWGLGPWHRSFWMTPHPIITQLRDLVYGREEAQYIQAFESTHVFGDMDNLTEKVWARSNLDRQYRELFKKWHGVLSEEKSKNDKMSAIVYAYVDFLRQDPGLPVSLIGSEWIGFEAVSIFCEIRSILLG